MMETGLVVDTDAMLWENIVGLSLAKNAKRVSEKKGFVLNCAWWYVVLAGFCSHWNELGLIVNATRIDSSTSGAIHPCNQNEYSPRGGRWALGVGRQSRMFHSSFDGIHSHGRVQSMY